MATIIDIGRHTRCFLNQFAADDGRGLCGRTAECGSGCDAVADEQQVDMGLCRPGSVCRSNLSLFLSLHRSTKQSKEGTKNEESFHSKESKEGLKIKE